jgi:DnaJ-class molecular chaperone
MDDDVELSEYYCPKCGESLYTRDCEYCAGEGINDDLHEEDPLWYDEDDWEYCSNCYGKGYFIWCGNKGCDVTDKEIKKAVKEQSKQFEDEASAECERATPSFCAASLR